jgi:N-acetylmuramoyl-L-alanine amidase
MNIDSMPFGNASGFIIRIAKKFRLLFVIICALFTQILDASAINVQSAGVLIDPGHSSASPGAISCTGKPEYIYNEELAKEVVSILGKHKVKVSTTHDKKQNISLVNRAQAAKGKDLILSLHHDSVQPQFIKWDKKRQPCSFKARGYSIFISPKNKHYNKSLCYAKILGSALLRRGLVPTLHHAENIPGENRKLIDAKRGIYLYDDLIVLKNSDAPAVLLEAAVIVNPKDETRARSGPYRRKIADAILEMVTSPRKK